MVLFIASLMPIPKVKANAKLKRTHFKFGCLSMESCAIYNPQDIRAEIFEDKTRLTNPEEWSGEVEKPN